MKFKLFISLLIALCLFIVVPSAITERASSNQSNIDSYLIAGASQEPQELDWAKRLIDDIQPQNNAYTSKNPTLKWKGVDGATKSQNRTVCSSFITRLLKRAYGYTSSDIKNWIGLDNPKAANYYDTITAQKRFQLISQVSDIKPGDILAIKYSENDRNTTDAEDPSSDQNISDANQCPTSLKSTGHVVLISQAPIVHNTSPPVQSDLTQYSLKVIDSSKSGHGCKDTRLLPNKSCNDKDAWDDGGVGQGTMRLYVDRNGVIAGYTWSLRSKSTYYSQNGYENKQGCQIPSHPLVVGRLSN
ncbi:MAG: hypothetical protein V7K76_03435 [Nostoc sp.]|uniref:hypothetical protein n=1 Tax=Nostoc sp. TaxID=1180 RepID=UPI002FFA1E96